MRRVFEGMIRAGIGVAVAGASRTRIKPESVCPVTRTPLVSFDPGGFS